MSLTDDIVGALCGAGISAGDTVFVHSGMRGLAMKLLASGQRNTNVADAATGAFHDALVLAVGDGGAIAAPAFFYDYARNRTPFDAATSVPDRSLGVYPPLLLKAQGMRRSLCPPVSIMAVGKNAAAICDTGTAYGYGSQSPWQRLVDLGGKLLFWDISPRMMTFVHHVETLVGVPHIYNKVYDAPVTGLGGSYDGPVVSAVRYLDERFEIVYDLNRFIAEAANDGLIAEHTFDRIDLFLSSFSPLADYLGQKLAADPYYLLAAPPRFVPGVIPADGAVGKANPKFSYVHEK
ncbi:MAG: AAC(3) family N-acetyltransferase [Rhodospirillales bacterium]|nr:AAC(3) family N-acetyltransferase [Rhodospirillales bacterium]